MTAGLSLAVMAGQFVPRASDAAYAVLFGLAENLAIMAVLFAHPAIRRAIRPMLGLPRHPFELAGIGLLRWILGGGLAFLCFFLALIVTQLWLPQSLATLIPVETPHTFDLAKAEPLQSITRYLLLPVAATMEELVFRAGIFLVLANLNAGPAVIVLVSATAFGLAHTTSGATAMAFAFLAGIGQMGVFLMWRSLPPLIFGHYIYNLWRT
ncbi:MAG: CPBP family intramembrane metalloprotease [Magnetospirillum sp. WYHS-4]